MHAESGQPNRRRMTLLAQACTCLAGLLPLTGCSHAPEYTIFGSFFPVWIFCSAGGLLLMSGVRVLIGRTAVAEYLSAPVLSYLSMAIFFACLLWLLFYN